MLQRAERPCQWFQADASSSNESGPPPSAGAGKCRAFRFVVATSSGEGKAAAIPLQPALQGTPVGGAKAILFTKMQKVGNFAVQSKRWAASSNQRFAAVLRNIFDALKASSGIRQTTAAIRESKTKLPTAS